MSQKLIVQMANKHGERSLSSLSHQGNMQIKTTTKYHYTHIRMVKIKETDKTKSWQGREVTGIFIYCCYKVIQTEQFDSFFF